MGPVFSSTGRKEAAEYEGRKELQEGFSTYISLHAVPCWAFLKKCSSSYESSSDLLSFSIICAVVWKATQNVSE